MKIGERTRNSRNGIAHFEIHLEYLRAEGEIHRQIYRKCGQQMEEKLDWVLENFKIYSILIAARAGD